MQGFQQKPVWHISVIEPYYFIQGTFIDTEMEIAKSTISEFAIICKRMQTFLVKFIDFIAEHEQKHDKNRERIKSLNAFLYEYERQSVESYSPNMNIYLGKT